MLEKDLYQKFKKVWQPNYANRIEPKYSGGISDVLIVSLKTLHPIFLELKVVNYSPKHLKVKIRPSQVVWLSKYPGIAYILIGINYKTGEPRFCLFHKDYARDLLQGMDWERVVSETIFTQDLIIISNFLENNK